MIWAEGMVMDSRCIFRGGIYFAASIETLKKYGLAVENSLLFIVRH